MIQVIHAPRLGRKLAPLINICEMKQFGNSKIRQPKSIHEMSYGRIELLGSGKTNGSL